MTTCNGHHKPLVTTKYRVGISRGNSIKAPCPWSCWSTVHKSVRYCTNPSNFTIMRFSATLLSTVALVPTLAWSLTVSPAVTPFCQSPSVVSSTTIGENNDVQVQTLKCANAITEDAVSKASLDKRQVNVCTTDCTRNCFTPSGGGPDPNECHVIADALLFDSQNVGALLTIPANASVVTLQFRSCLTFFVNQAGVDEQFCRTGWSSIIDNVAFNCQATQNAHGGNCVPQDQRWFIQVQNVNA